MIYKKIEVSEILEIAKLDGITVRVEDGKVKAKGPKDEVLRWKPVFEGYREKILAFLR